MAKVYGTDLPDILTGLFDGITDGDDIIFGFGGSDQIFAKGGNDICRAATDTTTSTAAMASTPRTMATPRKE